LSACIASHHLNQTGTRYLPIHHHLHKTKKDCLSRALITLQKKKKENLPPLLHAYPLTEYPAFPSLFPLLHVLLSSDGEPGDWLFGCFLALLFFSFFQDLGYNERRSRSYDDESMGIRR